MLLASQELNMCLYLQRGEALATELSLRFLIICLCMSLNLYFDLNFKVYDCFTMIKALLLLQYNTDSLFKTMQSHFHVT